MFVFIEPDTLSSTEKAPKKRKANMFIMYRKDMMKYRPHNMPMTKFNRDQKLINVNVRAENDQIGAREDKISQDYRDQIEYEHSTVSLLECNLQRKHQNHKGQTINEANNLPKGMKKDCYLTDNPSENF
ncbi:8275_t:CDS:2 [Funneliformis mosseae]|uniref:8275_t:CDS:1 n=1 Tax=Funneliformis mosseae TaxID=27381 RepID=A0A9N9FDG2_FUNMO|nr:8275_t:CDS:2 [Funneliformis mosseae]